MRNPIQKFRRGFARAELACVIAGVVLIQGFTIYWLFNRNAQASLASKADDSVVVQPATQTVETPAGDAEVVEVAAAEVEA